MYRITKGLDLPITGQADPAIVPGPAISRVGLEAADFIGLKPSMQVQEGDIVRVGQPLFLDRKANGVVHTAPAAGRVVEIRRGERRSFQALVIEVQGNDAVEFPRLVTKDHLTGTPEQVRELLVSSGLWTAFRTRPYSKVPAADTTPRSIFVQAIDTNPLAPDPIPILQQREADFRFGLQALATLTTGRVFVCHRPENIMVETAVPTVTNAAFAGPHPAGLPGTHIHLLDPVGPGKVVWTIHYQDVIAIGHLVATGRLDTSRVITVAGPEVLRPRTIRTQLGAALDQLTKSFVPSGRQRVISGSVLSGRRVDPSSGFLGRYHLQVSILPEGGQREFLGWMLPGARKFSIKRVFSSALDRTRRFAFTTDAGGSHRAMVPIGMYEQVMPLDILPTFLLRSLITKDTEQAQALGCLELDEEDLSLCTFVCPGKTEYGPLLRESLNRIELEG